MIGGICYFQKYMKSYTSTEALWIMWLTLGSLINYPHPLNMFSEILHLPSRLFHIYKWIVLLLILTKDLCLHLMNETNDQEE